MLKFFIFDLCLVLIWGKVWICVLSYWVLVLNCLKPFGIKKNTKRRGAQLVKYTRSIFFKLFFLIYCRMSL